MLLLLLLLIVCMKHGRNATLYVAAQQLIPDCVCSCHKTQKSLSAKPRGKSLKSQRATQREAGRGVRSGDNCCCCCCCCFWQLSQHRVAVIVPAVFILCQPCLVSSPSSLANQTELKALSGPVTPIFNVRDLTGMDRRGDSQSIGIGIGYVQLLELPCTYIFTLGNNSKLT